MDFDFSDINEDTSITDFRYELLKYNYKFKELINNGQDYLPLIYNFRQSGISNYKNFTPALYSLNVIGPRYYIKNKDITLLMNEYWLNRGITDKDVLKCFESIENHVSKLTNELMYNTKFDIDPNNVFRKYKDKLDRLHKTNFDNVLDFRLAVKELTEVKRDCEFRLNFKISKLNATQSHGLFDALTKEEAFKMIDKLFLSNTEFKVPEEPNMNHWEKYFTVTKDKSSLSSFLNDLGFNRGVYNKYFKGEYFGKNIKQSILNLSLYVELPTFEYNEQFFNLHGFSLDSYDYINEYCELTSKTTFKDIKFLIQSFIDKDVISWFLKRFSPTRQNQDKEIII